MKRVLAVVLALAMIFSFAACGEKKPEKDDTPKFDPSAKAEGVMTYAQYSAAKTGDSVTIEAYVQGHQVWWQDTVRVYAQDPDGAYFLFDMKCSKEDVEKLVPGTKLRVEGQKAEFGGEIEITNGTFTIEEGSWIAEAEDVTALLGTDGLIKHMNEFVSFKGLTVSSKAVFKWDGSGQEGDDLYFDASINGKTYTFAVESDLCSKITEVYKAVLALEPGDKIDLEGFLYWYEGANPHITKVTVLQ